MCTSTPKIKDPTEYSPAKAPEVPDTKDMTSKGRRATLLTSGETVAAPTAKKTLLGQ